MTCITWNGRCLAAATINRELNDLIKGHRLATVFLMETIACKQRVERVRRNFLFQHGFCVEANGILGGLSLLWNDYYKIQILGLCWNFIHATLQERRSGHTFEITFVYKNPTFAQRRTLLQKLSRLKPSGGGPWCLMGDFNEMLHNSEKDNTKPVGSIRMTLFKDFLNTNDLMDVILEGSRYTWISNPHDG